MSAPALRLDRCPRCGAFDLVERGERTECMACGSVMHAAELVTCPRCGEVLVGPSAACATCAEDTSAFASGDVGPKGVGGWLAVLAVSLAVLSPAALVVEVVRLAAWDGPSMTGAVRTFAWIAVGVDAALIAALAWAGVFLLTGRRGAVRLCRRALVAAPFAALADVGIAFLLLDPPVFRAFLPVLALALGRDALAALGWLAYLHRSRRVRNTFPE